MMRLRLAGQAALLNPADSIWPNSLSSGAWCKSISRIGWEQRARCKCGIFKATCWLLGLSQFQRGVDESVNFERFPPERPAHSASDLGAPIGSLAARL
jgi:hypothetical protein